MVETTYYGENNHAGHNINASSSSITVIILLLQTYNGCNYHDGCNNNEVSLSIMLIMWFLITVSIYYDIDCRDGGFMSYLMLVIANSCYTHNGDCNVDELFSSLRK